MSDILTDTSAGVLTITLNRVDKKNSITAAMYASMADALAQAEADPAVRRAGCRRGGSIRSRWGYQCDTSQ